jgi:4-hydroxybenzoate polyprenyltransferase
MELLHRALAHLCYGPFWIAGCAAACVWALPALGGSEPPAALVALVGCATASRYALVGFTAGPDSKGDKFRYAWRYRRWLQALALASALGAAACLPWLDPAQWAALAHLAIISLAYLLPLFGRPLRHIPYLKIVLIAYVWAWSIWLLPLLGQPGGLQAPEHWAGFGERFLFLLAITIPFDMRDAADDRARGLKTLPLLLGHAGAKWLGIACLCIAAVMALYAYPTSALAALALSYATAALLIAAAHERRHDLYFLLALDGTLLLQAMALRISAL